MSEKTEDDAGELLGLQRRTFAQSARVIARVAGEHLTRPTPCPALDVQTLAGHMLFAAERVAAAGRRQPLAEDAAAVTAPPLAELPTAFAAAADSAMEAWSHPQAMEGDIVLPFGTFPAAVVVQIYVIEQATHAWDLAVAIGARDELDEALAESALALAEVAILPEYRGAEPMPFGPVVDVPEAAPAHDRLAGFMGRRPNWTAATTA